jgi:hypothetical protein
MSRYTGESQRFLAQLPYGKTTAARDAFRAADADTVDRDARSLAPAGGDIPMTRQRSCCRRWPLPSS